MMLTLDSFEIDPSRCELRKAGVPVPVEKRVFNLLYLLARNSERLVTKDEIVEVVWDGRIVSDSAISTAIKEARKAVGDNGNRQAIIATVHGRGFRCVANVRVMPEQPAEPILLEIPNSEDPKILSFGGKPTIAVLPFQVLGPIENGRPLADAIPAELISALSRLRWINVIARGSSFRFREPDVAPATIRKVLSAGYYLSGVLEESLPSLAVTVELTETRLGNIVWAERYKSRLDLIHEIRSEIVAGIISAIELQIPLNEANAARLVAPHQLDAWSAYHIGLQHMYRFNRSDNAAAAGFFKEAIRKEPDFARAHAALSFTRFQNAFMRYAPDRNKEIAAARQSAETSLEIDQLDPFANYNMGRVCWLTGDLEGGTAWLERSVQISPNFAQGHYVKALMSVLAGRGEKARESSTRAMSLSPLDPLYYAMLGTHAESYLCDSDYAKAAEWAERAARSPGAHHLLAAIAAIAHHLNGDDEKALQWVRNVRARRPDMSAADFFNAFPFAEGPLKESLSAALKELGWLSVSS